MKPILTILACVTLASTATAQLVPMDSTSRDLSELDRSISGAQYYLALYVSALNRTHATVWSLPDDRLKAALEKVGPAGVAQLVELQIAAGTAANSLMDAAGMAGPRAATVPSREFSWSGNTVTVTPLPVPVVEPTPEPTPEP